MTLRLKRITKSDLLVLRDGERIGLARQGAGGQQLYTAKIRTDEIFCTEFAALTQRDLLLQIGDWLEETK